jgi:peptidyl-prolyl cis-trans isomerase C
LKTSPVEIRARAERVLIEVLHEPERFADLARQVSNCPSDQQGGNVGQLSRGDTTPEFEAALFRPGPTGILRQVIKTRFGFHIVAIDRRIPGETPLFDLVKDRIAEWLKARTEQRALRQYVSILAGAARLTGVDLKIATSLWYKNASDDLVIDAMWMRR